MSRGSWRHDHRVTTPAIQRPFYAPRVDGHIESSIQSHEKMTHTQGCPQFNQGSIACIRAWISCSSGHLAVIPKTPSSIISSCTTRWRSRFKPSRRLAASRPLRTPSPHHCSLCLTEACPKRRRDRSSSRDSPPCSPWYR